MINAERAALHAPDFVVNLRNVRKLQLKQIVDEFAVTKKSGAMGSLKSSKGVETGLGIVRKLAHSATPNILHRSNASTNPQDLIFEVKYKPDVDSAFLEPLIVEVTHSEIICRYVSYWAWVRFLSLTA